MKIVMAMIIRSAEDALKKDGISGAVLHDGYLRHDHPNSALVNVLRFGLG